MLKLPVWKTMTPSAKALLIEVLERYNGINNGSISYSCRAAQDAGVLSKNTASKAFAELRHRGFLRPGRKSNFQWKATPSSGRGANRLGSRAQEWWITFVPGPNGEKPTMEYLNWQP
jgi:hypothetical protein